MNTCQFSSVQLLSRVRLFATPWTEGRQTSLSITNFQTLFKLMRCHPTISSSVVPFSPYLQSFQASGSFPMSGSIRWPKYWSFSFSISLSNEYSRLTPFRTDWLDILEVQGTLKSLLQHYSSEASILWCSAFFIAQLSHPYTLLEKP